LSKALKEKWSTLENDDEKVRDFQRKLYRKAKQEPKFCRKAIQILSKEKSEEM